MKFRTLVVATVATMLSLIAPDSSKADEIILKAGIFKKGYKSPVKVAFDKFVSKTNAEGKGLVQIGDVVGPEAMPPFQMGNAAKRGVLDLIGVPSGYLSNLVPGVQGFSASQVSAAEQRKNGAFELIKKAFMEKANCYLLAQYGHGIRFHIFTSKPIRTLADFKGFRLRTTPTYTAFFKALGAQTLQARRGEIFTAMERGVVHGFSNLNSEIKSSGWAEVVKYRIDPGFYDAVVMIAINLDLWKKMTAEQQAFLKKMGMFLEVDLNKKLGQEDLAFGEALVKEGMQVITLPAGDAEKFVNLAYKSTWDDIENTAPELGPKLRKLMTK